MRAELAEATGRVRPIGRHGTSGRTQYAEGPGSAMGALRRDDYMEFGLVIDMQVQIESWEVRRHGRSRGLKPRDTGGRTDVDDAGQTSSMEGAGQRWTSTTAEGEVFSGTRRWVEDVRETDAPM